MVPLLEIPDVTAVFAAKPCRTNVVARPKFPDTLMNLADTFTSLSEPKQFLQDLGFNQVSQASLRYAPFAGTS